MDESERQFILGNLQETRETFLAETKTVREDQARWKPTSDRWSILECAEHVAVSEEGMFYLLTREAMPLGTLTVCVGREREILARGTDRSKKFTAPETMAPTGRFATLAEALRTFQENRSRTITYVEGCGQELCNQEVVHPLFGRVTANECLALLTIHPARHSLQVRELRQHPQFPK